MNYNEDVFECTTKIVAAAMEEAEVEINTKGGEQVAEFFAAIYHRLTAIALGEEEQSSKNGSFEIFQDEQEEYHFVLKASNGEVIAESQGYKTKSACLKGIESVQRNASSAKISEVK